MALTKVTGHVVLPTTNIEFHNTKSTGIVTFTHDSNATSSTTGALQITGGVGIVKDLHVGGNITVGGTLTYDDVTNIDSLGIITARGGIHVGPPNAGVATVSSNGNASFTGIATALRLDVKNGSQEALFAANQLQFNPTATAYIDHKTTSQDLIFRVSNSSATDTTSLIIKSSGNLEVKHDLDVDGHTHLDDLSVVGVTTFNGLSTNDVIRVRSADSNGNSVVNILSEGTTGSSRILFSDTAATSGDGWISYSHNDRALTFTTAGTSNERLRIDSNGRLLIGHTTAISRHQTNAFLQIIGTTNDDSSASIGRWSADDDPSRLEFTKSRNATIGNHTAVQADDIIGSINFSGNDGTRYLGAAYIRGVATNPIADYDCAGYLSFGTNYGTTSAEERLRIDRNGRLLTGGETAEEVAPGGIHARRQNDGVMSSLLILQNDASSANTGVQIKMVPSESTPNDRFNSITVLNIDGQNKFDTIFKTCPGGTPQERLRIDSSGHLHAGYTSNFGSDHLNILASDGGGVSIASNNDGNATTGDILGSLSFQGYLNAQTYANAEARISALVPSNHTGSSAATDMAFYTKPSTTGPGSAPTERLRIENVNNVRARFNFGSLNGDFTNPDIGGATAGAVINKNTVGQIYACTDNADNTAVNDYQTVVLNVSRRDTSGDGPQIALDRGGWIKASIAGLQGSNTATSGAGQFVIYTHDYSSGANVRTERFRIGHSGAIHVSTSTNTSPTYININSNRSNADDTLGGITGVWNGNAVAGVNFKAGADTTNKDDGDIMMLTYESGTPYERFRIRYDGNIGINDSSPSYPLNVIGDNAASNGTGMLKGIIGVQNDTTAFGSSPTAGISFQTKYRTGPDVPLDVAAIWGGKENATNGDKDGYMGFATREEGGSGNQERMRITSDGKVVAGSNGAGYPERLQAHAAGSCLGLNSTSGAAELRFYESGTGRFRMKTLAGNPGILFEDWTNSATRAEIAGDGDFKIYTGTRGWSTVQYRSNNRGVRRHYREFGTGSSGSTFNLIRVRRHYWGWGHYRFRIMRGYYSGIVDSIYYLNGHGRNDGSYNPSYVITELQFGGDTSNFNYGGRISITSPSNSSPGNDYATFVDVQVSVPAYQYFTIEVEAFSSGYSTDTSNISSDAYALHN